MTMFEQGLLSLESAKLEITTSIRILFSCAPDMLKLDNHLAAESCISYLYVQMMESPEPEKLCNIFVDYIIEYAKEFGDNFIRKTIIMNLAKAMSGLRGNYIVFYMEGKNNLDNHCKCFSLIDQKGRMLYGLV